MSHLPGQPQFSTGLDQAGQPSLHEATVRGHSAPKLTEGSDGQRYRFAPTRGKKAPERKSGGFSSTHESALLPDTDPWGRQRRRRLGSNPDPDDDLN